jgi:4-amino-4-deoxy-L-arabinose transferase-like glycosyltransferase
VTSSEGAARTSGWTVLVHALLIKATLLAALLAASKWYETGPYVGVQKPGTPDWVWVLARGFDAPAYQGLAEQGYYDRFSRNYPLGYPLMIRAAMTVAGSSSNAAVLVSNLCGLAAVGVFVLLARRYSRGRPVHPAALLFACTPGVLAFGTVAYSEGPYVLTALLAWWAYLRAADGPGPGRGVGWLLLAGTLAGATVMIKHLGGPLLVALALVEGARVWRPSGVSPGRALAEALAVVWAVVPVAAYFYWKFTTHDLAGLEQDIWNMRFVPFGGPPSLVSMDIAPDYVAQIYATLPVAVLLLVKLWSLDKRLFLISLLLIFEALSFTGIAAQSSIRYVWSVWPLALGALALADRGVVWALCGLLFLTSLMAGVGHVLGSAAF